MVGRSIADICDQSIIFTEAQNSEVNMFAKVRYRGYGPTYHATYITLYGECEGRKTYRCHFLLKSISPIWDSAIMLNFPMVAQSPYFIICITDLILCKCIVS